MLLPASMNPAQHLPKDCCDHQSHPRECYRAFLAHNATGQHRTNNNIPKNTPEKNMSLCSEVSTVVWCVMALGTFRLKVGLGSAEALTLRSGFGQGKD